MDGTQMKKQAIPIILIQKARSRPAGNYNVGSVYGPSLTQKELDQVADALQKFIRSYNFSAMNDYQKVRTAMLYLESHCTYAADWSKNRANTAWGHWYTMKHSARDMPWVKSTL